MRNNYIFRHGLSRLCAVMTATALLTPATGLVAYAQGSNNEPAQVPLIVQGMMASPNIMLSFDNSGSMNDLVSPEDLAAAVFNAYYYDQTFHPYDRSDNGYGNTNKILLASDVTSNSTQMRAGRSPQINLIYYNPALYYAPWKQPNSDGSAFSDMRLPNPSAAPVYAAASGSIATIDLTAYQQQITNLASTRYCNGALRAGCNSSTSMRITPALYFIYKGPSVHNPDFRYTNGNTLYYNEINNASNYTTVAIMANEFSDGLNISALYRSAPANPQGRPFNTTDSTADNYIRISRPDCRTLTSPSGDVICTQREELQNFTNWYVYYRGRTRAAIGALTQVFARDYGMEFRLGWGDYSSYTQQGVRSFVGTHPTSFYNWLYAQERRAITGTPTRSALNAIGQYYMNSSNSGPWGAVPGTNDTTPQLACRKSYAILITDGGWNDGFSGVGNADGTIAPEINGPGNKRYQYTPTSPFMDNNSNTLADVAMYYWNHDLRPGQPPSGLSNEVPGNPAFWQNMVTHTVGFGVMGTLSQEYVDESVRLGRTINWPNPSGIESKIDDLLHAAVNGHGTFSSASNTEKLIESLGAIMESLAAANVTAPHWITATDYLESGNRAYVPSYVTSNWTGDLTAYRLTSSGKLAEANVLWTASSQMPAPAQRNIWIGTNSGPVEFTWSNVSANPTLKTALDDSENLLNFLRGDNSLANGTTFRSRNSNVLGDIVNSNPVLVGSGKSLSYGRLPRSVRGQSVYNAYRNSKGRRTEVLFVGGNDGMLHAFNADTGVEVFAYIPAALAGKLPQLGSTLYDKNHYYYVDGPLTLTDASIGGPSTCSSPGDYSCWRNVLLGSAGAGARTVFALDVTDPTMYSRSASGNPSATNMNKTVLWELTPQSQNGAFADLGYVMQPLQPGYIQTQAFPPSSNAGQNERWVAIFGNGAHSTSGKAVLYIVDLANGTLLQSITVDDQGGNGLMGVTLIRDSNQVITGAYAGDLKGNLWRFTFDYKAVGQRTDWKVTYTDNEGAPKPLFTTDGNRPITHAPTYTPDPKGGYMVLFGTGKYYDTSDIGDTTTEAIYGIWDNNLSTVSYSQLLKRAMKVAASGYYDLVDRNARINWNTERGWTVNLTIKRGQRNLFAPVISGSNVIFTTPFTEVTQNMAESCEVKGNESGVIVVNLFSGGLPSVTWDTNNDGVIDGSDIPYIGFPTNSSGPGSILHTPGLTGNSPSGSGLTSCANGVLGTINDKASCIDANDNTAWIQLF